MSRLVRRPSPAMAVALLALFVSLGGVSYGVATGSIDGREIRDNSVRGRDLRNNDVRTFDLRNNDVRGRDIRNSTIRTGDVALNTLTGIDINESKLGQVPSAARADAATAAESISGLNFRNVDYRSGLTATSTKILDLGGLQVSATCAATPVLEAATTVDGAKIRLFAVATTPPTPSFTVAQDESFDTGETFDLLQGAPDDKLAYVSYVRPDGGHVEVELSYDGAGSTCSVQGHAVGA